MRCFKGMTRLEENCLAHRVSHSNLSHALNGLKHRYRLLAGKSARLYDFHLLLGLLLLLSWLHRGLLSEVGRKERRLDWAEVNLALCLANVD
jgi:hypothetical protein